MARIGRGGEFVMYLLSVPTPDTWREISNLAAAHVFTDGDMSHQVGYGCVILTEKWLLSGASHPPMHSQPLTH